MKKITQLIMVVLVLSLMLPAQAIIIGWRDAIAAMRGLVREVQLSRPLLCLDKQFYLDRVKGYNESVLESVEQSTDLDDHTKEDVIVAAEELVSIIANARCTDSDYSQLSNFLDVISSRDFINQSSAANTSRDEIMIRNYNRLQGCIEAGCSDDRVDIIRFQFERSANQTEAFARNYYNQLSNQISNTLNGRESVPTADMLRNAIGFLRNYNAIISAKEDAGVKFNVMFELRVHALKAQYDKLLRTTSGRIN